MTLKAKIDAYKEGFKKKVPQAAQEVMHRATEDLRQSGIMDTAVGVGDAAPGFTLENTDGAEVALSDRLTRGPVVLMFYRGRW